MTVDGGKGFTLPSGPSNLCFDKEEFMRAEFHVDKFVVECRRHVQLESLRDDLNIYLKILKSAMIELINKDYADFVNLSTNLVGMDKAISSLTVPLGQLKEEVLNVQNAMDEAIAAVEEKLRQQQEIQNKKACLQRLLNINQSVEKIEHLLGIKTSGQTPAQTPGHLSGQLIERVATEFNKLQFYVTKSRGLPLVEKIKPRIAMITTTLQYSLEGSFLEGLESCNVDILRQCLRTYALIDKTKDAEMLFRQHVVKPYMEEVITEQFIRSHDLHAMFAKVLEFVPKKCKVLRDVTSGGSGTTEVVRGYDFLVNSVWPEIVSNLEARTPSIFAPGNPNIFHEKYKCSMDFLARFERLCGSQASVERLRDHPSYQTFITKWSLPVYFQIRFQEIAGAFELALVTGLNKAEPSSEFRLLSADMLWEMLGRGWAEDVFLPSLVHRFWKLDLQLLSRYTTWLDEIYEEENVRRKEAAQEKLTKPAGVATSGVGTPPRSFSPQPPESSSNPPITIGQIVCLISDSAKLTQMLPGLFDKTVLPRLHEAEIQECDTLKDCLSDSGTWIDSRLPKFEQFLVGDVITQCSVYLKQVSDIPRLYRRTNREIPTKPSTYAINLLKPLKMFIDEHNSILGQKLRESLLVQVFSALAVQYCGVTSEVLTSVKKMEDSLKRLKKARGSEKSSGTHGMSDDDKIRQQIVIDISTFGKEMETFGLNLFQIEDYKKLEQLSEEAKATISS